MTPVQARSAVEREAFIATVQIWLRKYRMLWLGFSGVLVLIVLSMGYLKHRKQVALADLRMGIAELQRGNPEKAISYLEKVQATSAIGAEAQAIGIFSLAEVYGKQERQEDAKKAYEEALALAKRGGEKAGYLQQMLLLKLGEAAVQRGDQAQARQWYDQAVSLEEGPFQSEALVQGGQALEKANDRAAAALYYEKLMGKERHHPLAEVLKERVGK